MPRLAGCQKRKAVIYILEPSALATFQLRRALRRKRNIAIFPDADSLRAALGEKSCCMVFVLDRGTLPAPLSTYLQKIRIDYPGARTVVLDCQLSKGPLIELLGLGVHGFVCYSEVEKQLALAVHLVSQGHLRFDKDILEAYVAHSLQRSDAKGAKKGLLTQREENVVDLIKQKLSNKEISSLLGISQSTVKFHLLNIFNKLGVRNRQTLAEQAATKLSSDLSAQAPSALTS